MVDTSGHLGCILHVQLTRIAESMWKYIFCMQRSDSGACMRKHTTTGYAVSFLKELNAKETFHAHKVSTRTLCVSSKGIASKVQNSCSAKPSCAELCEYQGQIITIANNMSDRRKEFDVLA